MGFSSSLNMIVPRRTAMGFSSRTFLTVSLALFLALAFTTPTFAQQVFGAIYGTITDASGAAVANAKITISDAEKGTKFEVTTDANGNFNKGQLIPGNYKVL